MRNRTKLQIDPLAKAAECSCAIERIADPDRRIVLESLRRFWIALSNELACAHERFSTVNQIHTELIAASRSAMH